MKVLGEGKRPEEERALDELSMLWQQRNLLPIPAPRKWARSSAHLTYAAVGIVALLLLVVLIGKWRLGSAQPVPTQIVDALVTRVRPFEPRIVGQPYLTIQEVNRGPEDTARDGLEVEMTEKSAESYEMGRFFLLRKKYPKAIKYLKTAIAESKGVSADVYNDLGVAYMENGEASFAAAESEFKEVLSRNPAHAPAVFNLSILYGRQGRIEEAEQRRRQYLSLDPDSGWAKELRKKLLQKEPIEP